MKDFNAVKVFQLPLIFAVLVTVVASQYNIDDWFCDNLSPNTV